MSAASAWLFYAPNLAIARGELNETFTRAAGPGGQHVNTTSSAVELRFDARGSPNLPDHVKAQLPRLAGRRMTQDGVIVIRAEAHRSQVRNREDAVGRLLDLLRQAAIPTRTRRSTRPTLASKTRRLASKSLHSALKSNRRKILDRHEP